jgi:hypothetical protein
MTQKNRHDAILIKIVNYEDGKETMVSSYYTTAIDQTLKMFITAKEYELDCFFNEYSDVVAEEYKDYPGYIVKDVCLHLGSDDDIPFIEVEI